MSTVAIGFARFAFVKRSEGKNACHKSAYNSRSLCHFEGTKFQESCTYSFTNCKDGTAYSEVFLPEHVDEKFKNREYLWNAVEKIENRKNSQVSWEMVFALPDDECVTLEDKIELCQRFVKECFVSYGSAVQVDIHYPSEGKNWHAHFLGTLREFDETGKEFSKNKMREGFIPDVRNGRVMFPENWRKYAVDLQNNFFEEKGYDITVDPSGAIAQKHIGPQRFRGRSQSLIEANELRKELNQEALRDPEVLLNHITKSHSVFDYDTVDYYVQKIEGLSHAEQNALLQNFWKQSQIIPLYSQENGKLSGKYTIQAIVEEEKSILRNAERLRKLENHKINYNEDTISFAKHLRTEQKDAFKKTIEGDGIVCINGLAGTGKSTLLEALKNLYEDRGYTVRGMGPDTATCSVLREKGFESSENIHRFLFNHKYGKREIEAGHEVWIVDESSKIGNAPLKELLKVAVSNQVKVIFTGDISQLSPVERGTAFTKFCETFGYISLENIQRQEKEADREIVKLLSGIHGEGTSHQNTHKAIDMMANMEAIHWDENKIDSIKSLITSWAKGKVLDPQSNALILALKKEEVQVLNDVVRLYRKRCGELGEKDYLCQAPTGTFVISEGDHILFKQRNEKLGLENGDRGVLKSISSEKFSVQLLKKGEIIEFSPEEYSHFQLGYVSTNFGAQGSTYDRLYVMGSAQMRRDAHYVASSRHTKSFKLFISKDEIDNIATLKQLASRSIKPATTLGLITEEALADKQKLEGYKNSDSILIRTYGKAKETISKWDIWSRYSDLSPDVNFYRPEIDRTKGLSLRIINNANEHPDRVITNNAFIKSDTVMNLEGINTTYNRKILQSTELPINISQYNTIIQEIQGRGVIDRELETGTVKGYEFIEDLYHEIESLKAFSKNTPTLANLIFEKATLVSDYHFALEACNKIQLQASYWSSKTWKQAVITRNKAAHKLTNTLDKEELKSIFSLESQKEIRSSSQKQQGALKKLHKQEDLIKNKGQNTKQTFKKNEVRLDSKIPENDQKLIDDYLLKTNQATMLREKSLKEAEQLGISKLNTSFRQTWFAAAKERNEAANLILEKVPLENIRKVLSDVQVKYAKDCARKFKQSSKLSSAKQNLVDDYRRKSIHASSLYKKGEQEAKDRGVGLKNTTVMKEFFHATSVRNEAAYILNRTLSKEEISTLFTEPQTVYIKNYADKFEKQRNNKEQNTSQHIEKSLKSNMEALCQELFPDGYTSRSGTTLRYGNKGSLSVNISGRYVGTFKQFEEDESGGPIALIQKAKGFSFPEAMKYAKGFLSISSQTPIRQNTYKEKSEKSWISVIPPANIPPPSFEQVNPKLAKDFQEVARYSYKDEEGNLLFCILRFESKEGESKKGIRPLSYGFDQSKPGQARWSSKGYQSESKAIYGLEKLSAKPNVPILIVEGEKTKDAASKLLEKDGIIVISWVGGTESVNKVDWSPLKGRDVIIWPDNDKPGFKAAKTIVSDLRQLGVNSLKLVDPQMLEKRLPEKWDLADNLPKEIESSFIKDSLKNASDKVVPLNSLIASLKMPKNKEEAAIFRSFASEILFKVDNRLREYLEKKHGNKTWEIKNEILKEASKIINSKDEISKKLHASGINGNINERLTAQYLYTKAGTGTDPTPLEVEKMKITLKEVGKPSQGNNSLNISVSNHTFDKAFLKTKESGHHDLSAQLLKKELREQVNNETKTVSEQVQRDMLSHNLARVQQRQMER